MNKELTCEKTTDGKHLFRNWNVNFNEWSTGSQLEAGEQIVSKCVACGLFKGEQPR